MKRVALTVMSIILVAVIIGCSTPPSVPAINNSQTPVASKTLQTILASSATSTRRVALISTNTPVPLPSLQPTLSADEAKGLVVGLLKNNGNCEFPCMLGIKPDQTTLTDLDHFMNNFGNTYTFTSSVERRRTDQTGGVTVLYRENDAVIKVYFTYYLNDKQDQIDQLSLLADSLSGKGVEPNWMSSSEIAVPFDNAPFSQALEYYTLPKLLTNYGIPSQVLVGTFPDDPYEPSGIFHEFSLVLFYPERGIFAEYLSPREEKGDYFVGCPARAPVSVAVWPPESKPSLKSIVKRHGGTINELNLDYFKSVDEAVGMSPAEFYEMFKNSSDTDCLKTPVTLWPQP